MVFSHTGQKKNKRIIKLFLVYILLNFPLYSFSFSSLHFDFSENFTKPIPWGLAKEVFQEDSIEKKIQNSVWQIHNFRITGTAFFIGPNLFVTNFHVMNDLLKGSLATNVVLQQKGISSYLRIRRILQISALHDLVFVETEESVINYLNIKEDMFQPNEELLVLGYPKGEFKEIKKTGRVVDKDRSYAFPLNHSFLNGASGSPVLNTERQVVGVLSLAYGNISVVIKSKQLNEMIAGNNGLNCSDFINSALCIEEEIDNLKQIAERGDAYAQYQLARYYEGTETDQNLVLAFDWMKKSAKQGYIYAQNHLGGMYYHGRGTTKDMEPAFIWMKKSAKQGHAFAQSNLADMYYHGEGTKPNREIAFKWKKKSAEQGDAMSQRDLASMYYVGEGTEKNLKLAVYWLKESARQGYTPAQNFLVNIYDKHLYDVLLRQRLL